MVPNLAAQIREQIWQSCNVDRACATAFPDIENVFLQTQQTLNTDPVEVQYAIDGAVHSALIDGNRFSSLVAATPNTPSLVWNVAHGNHDVLAPLIAGSMGFDGPNTTAGAFLSMICPYLAAQGQLPPGSVYETLCPNLADRPLEPSATQPISSTIPTLVLNGSLDSLLPVQAGQPLADELHHSTAAVVPGLTHAFGADSNSCILAVQNDFLDNPHRTPDTSCVKKLRVVFPGT